MLVYVMPMVTSDDLTCGHLFGSTWSSGGVQEPRARDWTGQPHQGALFIRAEYKVDASDPRLQKPPLGPGTRYICVYMPRSRGT